MPKLTKWRAKSSECCLGEFYESRFLYWAGTFGALQLGGGLSLRAVAFSSGKAGFGGGFGLSIGNNFTNITIAPSGIYNFNDYFALGTGLQYSYLKEKNSYSSNVFGASLIGLFSPIEEIQLSLEVEQINVNNKYSDLGGDYNRNFWNTGLFVGGGYREGGVTVGARLNLLFDSNKDISMVFE